jgi:hypothetical protein
VPRIAAVRDFGGLYEVTDDGHVWTLPKTRNNRFYPARELSQVSFQGGRRKVTLTKNGVQTTHRVHRIVAEAFLGYDSRNVLHRNGDPSDNRLENLYYGTQSDNLLDAVRHGTHAMAARTECPQGHEYTPENTLRLKRRNGRVCRTCLKLKSRARRAVMASG